VEASSTRALGCPLLNWKPGALSPDFRRKEPLMKSTLIALATAGLLASGVAGAQSYQYDQPRHQNWQARADDRIATVNDREARIDARIQRNHANGRLTDREARWLSRELRNIQAKERTYMADGRMSSSEFSTLTADLDRLANNVRRQSRDEDRAY
jgi:hypothetical protein